MLGHFLRAYFLFKWKAKQMKQHMKPQAGQSIKKSCVLYQVALCFNHFRLAVFIRWPKLTFFSQGLKSQACTSERNFSGHDLQNSSGQTIHIGIFPKFSRFARDIIPNYSINSGWYPWSCVSFRCLFVTSLFNTDDDVPSSRPATVYAPAALGATHGSLILSGPVSISPLL